MFTTRLISALSAFTYVAWAASPYQFTVHVGVDGPKCWPGKEIHDPCEGWLTGCTVDGILVTCDGDPSDGQMVLASFCANDKCGCVDGKSECEVDQARCWTGQIHDACNGAKNGCASGGILVECDEDPMGDDQMIWADNCNGTFGDGTCHCDEKGESTC